jgi:uncharacterized membrane protein (UPF0127 family)
MIKTSNKSIVVITGILLVVTSVLFLLSRDNKKLTEDAVVGQIHEKEGQFFISGGRVPISVTIADSEEERSLGLSGVPSLPPYTGKWFVFETQGMYGFWMKDMNFPIDIVWIDETMTIVGISENISPQSYPNVFYPPKQSKYVLEINSGESVQNSLNRGIKLKLLEK